MVGDAEDAVRMRSVGFAVATSLGGEVITAAGGSHFGGRLHFRGRTMYRSAPMSFVVMYVRQSVA